MPHYEHADLSFDYPRDWDDRSIVAVAAPASPGTQTASNVVVTRDVLGPGETFKAYSDRQLVELARKLERFELQQRNDVTVDGAPAVDIHFAWNGTSGPLAQRLTMVVTKSRKILSITATTSRSEAASLAPIFERILQSVKINDKG